MTKDINWGRKICKFGEITGFITTGYFVSLGYYVLSIIIFMVGMYLSDCALEQVKKRDKE